MDVVEQLQSAGLSTYEARAYAALFELGEATTGPLCEKSGVPSSHIYAVLRSLAEKGLVSHKSLNSKKVYVASPPEAVDALFQTIKSTLEESQSSLQRTLAALQSLPKDSKTVSDYQYFEGISGIKALFLKINEILLPDSEALVLSAQVETWEKIDAFLLEHHKIRVKKNVHERMILPASGKRMASARKDIGNIDIRYLEHRNEAEFGVFGDTVALLYIGTKTPRGFLIHDPLFAITFTNIFNTLWRTCKDTK